MELHKQRRDIFASDNDNKLHCLYNLSTDAWNWSMVKRHCVYNNLTVHFISTGRLHPDNETLRNI